MPLKDLTQQAVRDAMGEFRRLGRRKFLSDYGFGRSKGYFVEDDGRIYDSKALAGVAHKFLPPDYIPLDSKRFSGGDETVFRMLSALGFRVRTPRDTPV